jgi:hypothetical protein
MGKSYEPVRLRGDETRCSELSPSAQLLFTGRFLSWNNSFFFLH